MDGDDADDQCPGRLLQQAAIYNNVGLMESLLQGPERRNINAQDSYGRTALYTSITNNSFECMERLLLAGADTNISCGLQCGGMSPLHAAALDNKDRFVRLLLSYNADVNRLDASGESPLALALTNRSQDCVEIISEQLELNARLKVSFENDFVGACRSGNVEVAEGLLHGTILSRDDALRLADEHSLLKTVCEFEFLDVCEFLLDIGAAVEIDSSSGHNPFHVACINGYGDIARAILRCWPDQVEAQTSDGQTAIHLASVHGHVNIVKLLYEFLLEKAFASRASISHISRVVLMNVPDAQRRTPLHLAVINNRPEVVRYILNVLAPSASDGCDDRNPSHRHTVDPLVPSGVPRRTIKVEKGVCSRQPSKEVSDGADVDIEDDEGKTPLHYAVLGDDVTAFFDLAAILLQHKADPNRAFQLAGGEVTSLLREAFRRSDRAIVSLLLRHGAKDDDMRTIGDAMEVGDDEMIGVMIQYHSYLDAEYKPNHAALTEVQHRSADEEGHVDVSRSVSFGASGITISWHALRLRKIVELWILKACMHQLKKNHLCAEWVARNQTAALVFITRINISENGIEVLPEFLWQLPSLRSIDASNNKISTIFESRASTKEDGDSETEVCVHGAKDSVLNCPCLEEISLCKNQLVAVPCSFFQMPALKKLNLSHNAIECLPFEMWNSTSLLELNLAHNNIRTIPFQTEDKIFPKIQSAPVFTLKESPESAVDPPNSGPIVDTLVFRRNDTTAPLLNGVADGSTLPKHVNRWQDRVGVRPADELEGGTDLKTERRSQLQELNFSHNQLGDFPSALPCLAPHLEKLIVSHNRLREIGCAAIYPASLKFLDLSYNQIASCHASITSAIDITKSPVLSSPARSCYSPYWTGSAVPPVTIPKGRSISGSFPTAAWNVVSCRHRCHFRLDRLRALKLNNNKIRKFVFCYETSEDSFLSSVESSRTSDPRAQLRSHKRLSQISDFSDRKRSAVLYPSLTSLDLSHNELACLTSDVCELTQLAELKVSNNRIKELPPEMGLMRKLWNVDFSNCPVADSLRSLLGDKVRKTSAVLGYLKSIRDEAVPFNRMKLMFVGIQGIGKTSLLNQLRDRRTKNSHWMDRMGHQTQGRDQKGDNISTVGVDIGDLEIHGPSGKVIFSTWDFGGQKEYYATHQYFLSKRSLYLVVWKVTDGERGVNEILQWLINIQARVPGSPVIIVGTHRDLLPRKNREASLAKIDELIRSKYMPLSEPDKLGLPRVLGHIEVSCKNSIVTRNYIQDLRSLIWKVVSEEHLPGVRGTLLLDQKVPARYLHLQEIVETLAKERKAQHKDPVLHADQYKHMVIQKMEEMYKTCFQDMSELSQATQFLHENGVLLHYDEVHLQDVYFLDPQWLCDMLANVITIHEINRLAKSGVMKTDDVQVLFKGVAFRADDMKTYMINLLQKFEVALLWDHDHLLIPSLLPTESDVVRGIPGSHVLIPVDCGIEASCQSRSCQPYERGSNSVRQSQIISLSPQQQQSKNSSSSGTSLPVKNICNPAVSLVRLYLMSYFPCGFWPRLITRLLGDRAFVRLALELYRTDSLSAEVNASIERLKSRPQWQCWQTGLELKLSEVTILRLKEVSRGSPSVGSGYENRSLLIRHEDDCMWSALDVRSLSVLEVFVPNEVLRVQVSEFSHAIVDPETQTTAALLAAAVDRIDTLLEDWYPDIGMRFAQDTKGTYLITRLVPCIRCLFRQDDGLQELPGGWTCVSTAFGAGAPSSQSLPASPDHGLSKIIDVPSGTSLQQRSGSPPVRKAAMSSSSCDSGPAKEKSSRHGKNRDECRAASNNINSTEETLEMKLCNGIYCFLFEACIQTVQANKVISCPVHGNLGPCFTASKTGHVRTSHIAPDAIFQDVGQDRLVDPDAINLDRFLGRGAFGAVFGGTIINRVTGDAIPVAMKVLQPVKPTPDASPSQLHRYRAEKAKWDSLPVKYNCEAYLNARKELGIMLSLSHPSIVPLLGFSVTPLGLILSLAPQGDLSGRLQNYKRAGAGVPVYVIRDIVVQVASALQYLHSLQVIYRDLKSENVLVWSLPPPHSEDECLPVDVKLADYGVCRVVLPVGTKGFAGTPPFMAPEIIQHNGDEAYTEKVDCYSFGMFVYELLLLRLPYEDAGTVNGSNINLKSHVMSGGRPTITSKETVRQTGLLDLMTLCWSHDPNDRPSMREIVAFARSPEFCSVFNAVEIEDADILLTSVSARRPLGIDTADAQFGIGYNVSHSYECDVWLSLSSNDHSSGSLVVCTYRDQNCLRMKKLRSHFAVISVMCVTNNAVWCASYGCDVYVFRLLDYEEIGKLSVAESRRGTSIRCMLYSRTGDSVYIFLDDGDAVVCSAALEASCGGTPVLKEFAGNGKPVHCVAIITNTGSAIELWCGQGSGKIRVWSLESEASSSTETSDRLLDHFNTEEVHVVTYHLVTSCSDSLTLYSYVYPGTAVYCWDTSSKSLLARIDLIDQVLSKFSASGTFRNSLKSTATKWQVTCMNVIDRFLYIGTTGGCLVVVDRHSLTPLTLCQPHGDGFPNIRSILPLSFPPESLCQWEASILSAEGEGFPVFPQSRSFFVTVGKGYRDVAAGVMSKYAAEKSSDGIFLVAWSGDEWPATVDAVDVAATEL